MPELDIAWGSIKAQTNFAKHCVGLTQAATVLIDPLALTVFDAAQSESEERWFTLGRSAEGKLLAVAHTYRPTSPASVHVRIISARDATRREREHYENEPR